MEQQLRMLNGAHSGIAYLGALGGDEFVHQFVTRADGRRFVEALWDEAQATLDPPAGLDLAAYRGALMARFANPALQHRTRQIAMDGSQKLPQRLIAPIVERRAQDLPVEALGLAVAAWMRWQAGVTDAGERFAIDDPLADVLGRGSGVDFYLATIGATLDDVARATIARHLAKLEDEGARASLKS